MMRSPNKHRAVWLAWHGIAWLLAATVIWQSTHALAPQPAWSTDPTKGPSIQLKHDQEYLAALKTQNGQLHTITTQWHGVPPHVQPTLADKLRFEAIENWLVSLQGMPGLAWITRDGRQWPITWAPAGWAHIPTISWVLLVSSLVTWHMAIWNLRRQTQDTTTRLYAMAGIAFAIGNLIRAWLCARPWGLPTLAWDFQFWVSHFCGLCFLGCLLLMVLRIPAPAISTRSQQAITLLLLSIWVADITHAWPQNLSATYHFPMAALAVIVLLAQSWMAWTHREDAAYWAALRWFLIVFLMAILPPAVLYGAWAVGFIGDGLYDPVLVAPALGYCALSALLHRNRLIQIESWRSRSISVWVAGVITLGLMTTLVVRNDDQLFNTLGVSMLAMPWIYLAVRGILTFKTPASASERLQAMMEDIMKAAVSHASSEETAKQWIVTVTKAFAPQHIQVIPASTYGGLTQGADGQMVRILEHGLKMEVPHIGNQFLLLENASARMTDQHRTRPFTPTDAELATAMWRLMSHGLLTHASYLQGVHRERQRIASDLHDTIGGRLLHLSQTAANAHQRQYAISTLADLRNITRGLSRDNRLWLNVLADLRHQINNELDAIHVKLNWAHDGADFLQTAIALAEDAVAVNCVVNELIRNALEHAQATHIDLHWGTSVAPPGHTNIRMVLLHDCPHGNVTDPTDWEPGLGMNSIRRRIRMLEGQCEWTLENHGSVLFVAKWPMREAPR